MLSEVSLDNNKLITMLRDPEYIQLLPCLEQLNQLKQTHQSPKKCKPCSAQTSNRIPHAEYDKVRRCIASALKQNRTVLNRVKQKLGAALIRIKYMGTNKLIVDKLK